MSNELTKENEMLRGEIRTLHKAAALTADLVIKQFEQTELEKAKYRDAAANLEGFKRTLDQTNDSVFMFDPQTYRITYVNQGGINHSGYSEEELFTMSFAELGNLFTTEQLAETLAPLIENPMESLLFEGSCVRKNGIEVPVEVFVQYIAPVAARGRFFSIVRNITKRLLEEKEKEQMQAKLLHTQKLESVGELAAGIAHEINTPIQFIGTNLSFLDEAFNDFKELLQKYQALLKVVRHKGETAPLISEIEDYIDEIDLEYLEEEIPLATRQASEGIERVSKLVLAMKEFSHPGSKNKERADINKIIQTTVQISSNEWKYCADVELDLGEGLPQVPCHTNEIGQVILNLLLNSAHSIKDRLQNTPNSAKGRIQISTWSSPEMFIITLSDNGCGIPETILNKIFDPFFTTKEVGKGTGQGLAIARNVIMNKHEGEIEVQSEEGMGTTFRIHLPLEVPITRPIS